jgi:hypothetical protein
MRSDRKIRFFNAGDRIQTTLRYSDPGGHDIHCIANWMLDAPQEGFFEVPEEAEIAGAIVRFSFDRDIMRDFGARGVVMIDANYTPQPEQEQDDIFPIAVTEALAREKGARKWKNYVKDRVKEFMDQCEMIRSVAGVPRPATGVMLRYLKIMGMVDPSEAMLRESLKQTSLIETLTERLDRLEAENRGLKAQNAATTPQEPALVGNEAQTPKRNRGTRA